MSGGLESAGRDGAPHGAAIAACRIAYKSAGLRASLLPRV
jgi:hypothetical protein